jgi:hypothetical protein
MAQLAITPINRTGVLSSTAGAAATATTGDTFPNDGNTFLEIVNGGGSTITVTITPVRTVDGSIPAAKVISIPTTIRAMIGPFAPADYNDTNGLVTFICSAVTTVTAKALRPTL